jgi:hypothetical protein
VFKCARSILHKKKGSKDDAAMFEGTDDAGSDTNDAEEDVNFPDADSCASESSHNKENTERIALKEYWAHPGSTSFQICSNMNKEIGELATQSFVIHEKYHAMLKQFSREMYAIAKQDTEWVTKYSGQSTARASGIVSSHNEVDKRKRAKRYSCNVNSPCKKKSK